MPLYRGEYIPNVEALPPASADYRGMQLRVPGGAGLEDVVAVCVKADDDTYSWQLGALPTGAGEGEVLTLDAGDTYPSWQAHRAHGSITVAASNTPAWMRRMADYTCDGTADDVEWQAALNASVVSGTRSPVLLLPGSYYLSAGITWTGSDIIGGGSNVAGGVKVYWTGAEGSGPVFTKTNGGIGAMRYLSFRQGNGSTTFTPLTWLDLTADQTDAYSRLHEVHFEGSTGPLVLIGQWYNLHWQHVRFDNWGTYAVEINPEAGSAPAPFQASFAIENFTADSRNANALGFLHIVTPSTGSSSNMGVIRFANARIEMNTALSSPKALVHVEHRGATSTRNRTFALEWENIAYQDVVSDPSDVFIHRDCGGFVGQEAIALINCNIGVSTFWTGDFDTAFATPASGTTPFLSTMSTNGVTMDRLQLLGTSNASVKSFGYRHSSDANNRWEIVGSSLRAGNGTLATDVGLFRVSTGTLRVDPNLHVNGNAGIAGALDHDGTTIGFYGKTPAAQPAANPDTSGATLGQLETEVNELKAALRSLGLIAT